ncbi:cupin domain-containing protein [Poriferisphaera sp. WC338]|uniref:cupin domain-containing protein n=1 Tax=Poriferisphaera sp. WC338 TaxID=3425129 RepID=UPI003D816FB0
MDMLKCVTGKLPAEVMETVLGGKAFRVERIVSDGHCSDEMFWYDQDEHEWVMVLAGAAKLAFEKPGGTVEEVALQAGDAILIPAHHRHRVAWTSETEKTIWLAIFYID